MYRSGQVLKASVNNRPFIYHYGIVVVDANNKAKVLHNTPENSSITEELDDWILTRKIVSVNDTNLVNLCNEVIINRFNTVCKGQYNLINYNCEHFIDCMLSKKHQSEQLRKWVVGIAVAILLFLYYKRSF